MSLETKKTTSNKEKKSGKSKEPLSLDKVGRIKKQFGEFRKVILFLILAYLVGYFVWYAIASYLLVPFFSDSGYKGSFLVTLILVIGQGLLFTLEGKVTTATKTPFNQFCYEVNSSNMEDERKDYLIGKATIVNEYSKNTFNKLGILAIVGESVRVFIHALPVMDTKKYGKYAWLFFLSFLVPLLFGILAIFNISSTLRELEESLAKKQGETKKIKVEEEV